MKRTLSVLLTGIFLLAQAGTAKAVEYSLSTYLKPSSGVNIVAHSITAAGVWSSSVLPDLNMNFGDLVWTPGTTAQPVNLWLAPTYFAVDISNVAAGSPSVTISYVEGNKPNGAVHGLGYKTVASIKKEVYVAPNSDGTANPPLETAVSAYALIDLVTPRTIASSNFTGGWARVYLGVYSGSPAVANAEGFLSSDVSGTYTGKVIITATAS